MSGRWGNIGFQPPQDLSLPSGSERCRIGRPQRWAWSLCLSHRSWEHSKESPAQGSCRAFPEALESSAGLVRGLGWAGRSRAGSQGMSKTRHCPRCLVPFTSLGGRQAWPHLATGWGRFLRRSHGPTQGKCPCCGEKGLVSVSLRAGPRNSRFGWAMT